MGQHDINISEALETDPLFKDLLEKLHQSEALTEKVLSKSTSLQVCSHTLLLQDLLLFNNTNSCLFFMFIFPQDINAIAFVVGACLAILIYI